MASLPPPRETSDCHSRSQRESMRKTADAQRRNSLAQTALSASVSSRKSNASSISMASVSRLESENLRTAVDALLRSPSAQSNPSKSVLSQQGSLSSTASIRRTDSEGLRTTVDSLLRNPATRSLSSSSISVRKNEASTLTSRSSASVTRSSLSTKDINATADALLRSPTARSVSSPTTISPSEWDASPQNKALDSKAHPSAYNKSSSASSLSTWASSVSSSPPSYRASQQATRPRPLVVGSVPSAFSAPIVPTRGSVQKRSSSPPPITAAETKQRVRQAQLAVDRTNALTPRRNTSGMFRAICSTDVLFLMDTTSSMRPFLDAAKDQVRSIMDGIKDAFLGECVVRVAVVGYKDHCNEPKNIEFLDFTTSISDAREFLGNLKPGGGEGWTADALGGLRQASNATWMHPSRCIIHIADAPGHSRALHDMPESKDNKYYRPGSEPHGLTYEPVIRQLIQLNINFAFLQIHACTDRMVKAFSQVYHAVGADIQMLPSNQYYDVANMVSSAGSPSSSNTTSAKLLFQELCLGVDTSILKRLVMKSVTDSVTRTSNRHSLLLSRHVPSTGNSAEFNKSFGFNAMLSVVSEDEEEAAKVVPEMGPAQWNAAGWLDQTWQLEGYYPEVIVYSDSTLQNMMDSNDNIKLGFAQLTIHARSKPFGQGAQRLAYYARMAGSASQFVVKTHTEGGKDMAYLIEDMRVQALCKAFALEFNGLVRPEQSIDFLVTACLENKTSKRSKDEKGHMSLEPYLPGEYVKYNSNGLFVREDTPEDAFNRVAQAFSHFTFERSWGDYMVVDLQGVGNLLTDPAVHTKDPDRLKLNDTNLQSQGFKMFFANHFCNEVCKQLGLISNRDMAIDEKYTFRQQWPAMDPTICCSNKLCQKIVRLAWSKTSPKFPSYRWCADCWPQLNSAPARWICAAPGAHHEFDMYRFFYTSQGKLPPKKCPEHLEKDRTATSTASMGGGLWSQMKNESKRSVVLGNEY